MAFENMSLKEYYGLRTESLSIDPWLDSPQYFGDMAVPERIIDRIESDFVKPRGVPKFVVHGAYGSGKTHTLAFIKYTLENFKPYPTEPLYVNMAPLSSRERYRRIHTRLVDAISLDSVIVAVETVMDSITNDDKVQGLIGENILPFGDDSLKISQANIFRNLLFGGRQRQLSWEWMKGSKNSTDQAVMLGTRKDLDEPADFVNCLLNLGSLYFRGLNKKLVFLIDEAEAIRQVTSADAQNEIRFMIRLLLENTNNVVGTVFAVQVEGGMESIGEFFTNEDIKRRLDFDEGYIDLDGSVNQISDSNQFIRQAIQYLVNQEAASETIEIDGLSTTSDLFPFTEDAIEAITSHVADNPSAASPAFILSVMSGSAIAAWRQRAEFEKHVLVGRDIIEQIIFPEG